MSTATMGEDGVLLPKRAPQSCMVALPLLPFKLLGRLWRLVRG